MTSKLEMTFTAALSFNITLTVTCHQQHTWSTHLMARTMLYLSCSVNTGGPLCFAISAAYTTCIPHRHNMTL